MDVSSPTLHNHLRRAQQRLLTALFEGERRPPDEESGGWDS
jgi:predicted DNA binding protein